MDVVEFVEFVEFVVVVLFFLLFLLLGDLAVAAEDLDAAALDGLAGHVEGVGHVADGVELHVGESLGLAVLLAREADLLDALAGEEVHDVLFARLEAEVLEEDHEVVLLLLELVETLGVLCVDLAAVDDRVLAEALEAVGGCVLAGELDVRVPLGLAVLSDDAHLLDVLVVGELLPDLVLADGEGQVVEEERHAVVLARLGRLGDGRGQALPVDDHPVQLLDGRVGRPLRLEVQVREPLRLVQLVLHQPHRHELRLLR